ncbi:P-loop containing nucleoside triphosphate hydrolase protein, partial [Jimgerdemannia flammicorona]
MPRSSTSLRQQREALPIYPYRDELVTAIRNNNLLVVIGETGSGKTTQIPQYVLDDIPGLGRIGVTQPRRIAAITVAKRVSEEHGTPLGTTVGYTIRFDDRTTSSTRLKYMTDGVLLREATQDPRLSQYSVLVIDEAHERTLETDVLFGLLRRTLRLRSSDLRILVMSATLNVEKFSDFFGGCPIFSVPGRSYPVTIVHHQKAQLASLKSTYFGKAVETAMHVHTTEKEGDVLVFLTGQGEIERACREFREKAAALDYRRDVKYYDDGRGVKDVNVYPIYASLETFEQRAVFEEPEDGVRKIVFSTNIAQTSVTIPGIRYVIDSGFVKEKSFDPNTGMDALLVTEISQAAATQRAGRAGRTQPGKCYRLYTRSFFDSLAPETIPEIQRSSLLGTALSLKKMGIIDIPHFDFIDPPDAQLVDDALQQLYLLGAIDNRGLLTPLGDIMSRFPLSPFLSRALVASTRDFGCSDEVLTIASVMSVEEVFVSPSGKDEQRQRADEARREFADSTGDHLTLLNVYEGWRRAGGAEAERTWCRERYVSWRNLDMARNVRRQLEEVMEKAGLRVVRAPRVEVRERGGKKGSSFRTDGGGGSRKRTAVDPVPILKSFLTAYYVHLAKRHTNRSLFYHYSVVDHHSDNAGTGSGASRDSNSSMLALHISPQSALADDEASGRRRDDLDWVMYTHVTYTNRAIMRVVSKVLWEW